MPAKNLGSVSGAVERRTALGLLGGAGAVIGLSACASDGGTEIATTPPSGTVTESSSTAAGRQLLGVVGDIPVGSGVRYKIEDLEILVTQANAGEFAAFDATCTHAGCIVTGVVEGEIACACHGARFDMSTGAVLSGPARNALGQVPIVIDGEQIFADL